MSTDLHKWGRLFAAFAIIFGIAFSVLASFPDPPGVVSGVKADLLWPAIALGVAAAGLGLAGFHAQQRHEPSANSD
jgi:hypothetical protein